ncbi:Fur family transcriptional regulator [Tuberibacillus sp. Marseille-P3662]|uniref:Fur family transcriptional regulator n=1 Tax=Tuberibacillus sp. Marseille-P3662 TaxID=1965358 RepID=UPI000A1CCE37|nr:Fur family transcriptional regulator [Tuberibacillus sp. Marseille-P3662]
MEVQKALNILKKHGYKYTDKRKMLVELFAQEDRYLTAKDVLRYMQTEYPTLSYDTVYRNLSLFENIGILEGTELSGEKNYRYACGHQGHHHHLICTKCGKTEFIEFCPMETINEHINDFDISGHKFEIYGHCYHCQSS